MLHKKPGETGQLFYKFLCSLSEDILELNIDAAAR